jgi:hypothetical protein
VYIFNCGRPIAIKVSPNGPETALIKNPKDRIRSTPLDEVNFAPKSAPRIISGKKQITRNSGNVV